MTNTSLSRGNTLTETLSHGYNHLHHHHHHHGEIPLRMTVTTEGLIILHGTTPWFGQ